MDNNDPYLLYHGVLVTKVSHTDDSLKYYESFQVQDDDVIAITYPKSVIFGKWTDHVKCWRNTDLGDRILYITYEEMIQDLHGVLERMLLFLGKSMSKDALNRVTEHCTFKTMKQNKMSNYSLVPEALMDNKKSFLRKGIVGDWKNYFSPELESKFNTAISEELKGMDITFPLG
ncbi:hypothetical protein KOW79_018936 [Hemibagrus wyckioides]|uniref:Sulfotransferase n=1 Tax=Hemibagrus wyckioides TaxID=337641 RepID=A0A9D3SAZ4_9TELE|nr:hypothetical protein KOW79_018936 [Hemibagrus wyckioides]